MGLKGKVALVTGASRGIGQAIAKQLGAQGAYVVGTATSQNGAEKISAYMKTAGISGEGIMLNVTDDTQIAAVFDHMKNSCGHPDILVNNAGINRDNLVMRMSDSEWDDVISTNLNSIFKITKSCLRGMMKKKWGRIVSIGSLAGSAGNPGQGNYAAAKAGLIGFSKALAQEIASRNITVNVVAPGLIATDMAEALTDQQREAIMSKVPAGRLGKPEEIAETVSFLSSEGAAYITGNTIQVNGGMYMQ